MIARTVHKHEPIDQLSDSFFAQFAVEPPVNEINQTIMNIDLLECYA